MKRSCLTPMFTALIVLGSMLGCNTDLSQPIHGDNIAFAHRLLLSTPAIVSGALELYEEISETGRGVQVEHSRARRSEFLAYIRETREEIMLAAQVLGLAPPPELEELEAIEKELSEELAEEE
jgi:hypothetical protein